MSSVLDRVFQYNSVIDTESGRAVFSAAYCFGVGAAIGLWRLFLFRWEERCSPKPRWFCDIVLNFARFNDWIGEIACAARNKDLVRRRGAGPAHGLSLLQAHQRRTGQQA